VEPLTITIDDAGVGDLLGGIVIGAYRLETGDFAYDLVDVKFFQRPRFASKQYLPEVSRIVFNLLERLERKDGETIRICRSYVFEEAYKKLKEKYGAEAVELSKVVGKPQEYVETAYLDELRNLGYNAIAKRETRRAKSFFHMMNWVKKDPSRWRFAKTGWPRLRNYRAYRTFPQDHRMQR